MKPSKDFSTRYDDAKQWRQNQQPLIEEFYRFCAPARVNEFNKTRPKNSDSTVYHSLGEESAQGFAGDLVNYFTPPEARWFSSEIMTPVPEDMVEAATEMATGREDDISALITASNYYDIAPQIAFEAGHGTPAVWVQMSHLSQPIFFESVPPSELLITPGHLGYLDRFRCKTVRASTLKALLAPYPVTFSPKLTAAMAKPQINVECIWGFWLDWSDPGRPMWKMEITVDGERVTPDTPLTLGDMTGACPLLVGRFNPQPNMPWGRGPGLQALPDLRVLDKIEETVLLGLEDAIKTTLIYGNDGYLDLSEGIMPGLAYPAGARFNKDQIYELNKTTNLEVGFFTRDDMERRIRSIFFQDGPRQRGDTPPTATQWQDERRRVQQRLGKPSAPLWTELFGPMLQRVEYLAAQAGLVEPVLMLDNQAVTIRPVSPLQKAQNLDDVMISRSNLDLAAAAGAATQEGPAAFIDLNATFSNIVKASGDRLTVVLKEKPPVEPPPAAA